jgi:CheY-like chemotaxis protein
LREQIHSWGMRNGCVASGLEALPALREAKAAGDPYHFVLLDYQMPEMDGLAVATAIRSDRGVHDVAILLLTSAGCWRELQQTSSMPFDACLTKPVRQSHLLNTLLLTWAKQRQRGGPAIQPAEHVLPDISKIVAKFADSGLRVMVVEDNPINQRVAVRMLDRLGLTPDVASNGVEAVRLFRAQQHHVIFMDCQMPELDGYEATHAIRELNSSGCGPVIIAMTAEALAGAREKCLAAGMDQYISKPIKLEDLCRALDACIPAGAKSSAARSS